MSMAMDVVLIVGVLDDGGEAYQEAISRLALYPTVEKITAGAAAQHAVLRAAINHRSEHYMAPDDLADAISSMDWDDRESLLLIVADEHDERPAVYGFDSLTKRILVAPR